MSKDTSESADLTFAALEEPRFFKAIGSVEELLVARPDLAEAHYEARSPLATDAQQFDFVSGHTGATIEGDSVSVVRGSAQKLRDDLDTYSGPAEVKKIYEDIYGAELAKILGPAEND